MDLGEHEHDHLEGLQHEHQGEGERQQQFLELEERLLELENVAEEDWDAPLGCGKLKKNVQQCSERDDAQMPGTLLIRLRGAVATLQPGLAKQHGGWEPMPLWHCQAPRRAQQIPA